MSPRRYDIIIDANDPTMVCDALVKHTGLSKTRIKQAMTKGAVWLHHSKNGARRLRRATAIVRPADRITLYYDDTILATRPPTAHCVADQDHYGIWFKPAGLLVQGTRFGDHCALLRQVEHHFKMKRKIYPIHRIDREVAGLVLMGYTRKATALISRLFHESKINKKYRAWVLGNLSVTLAATLAATQVGGVIDSDLDGKQAVTSYEILRYDSNTDQSLVDITIHTGRYHQIRRHFALIDHPIIGDPRYGRNNKNTAGLQLIAYHLGFICPFTEKKMNVSIDPEPLGFS